MRRREFITLLGGAASAWPFIVRAQQSERMRRVGLLVGYSESDAEGQASVAAFRQRLRNWAGPKTAISGSKRAGLAPIGTEHGLSPKSWSL